MKKCIDCKWFGGIYSSMHRCNRIKIVKEQKIPSVVNAVGAFVEKSDTPPLELCELQRAVWFPFHYLMNECGRHGRWWEPKDPINQLKDHVERNGVMKC